MRHWIKVKRCSESILGEWHHRTWIPNEGGLAQVGICSSSRNGPALDIHENLEQKREKWNRLHAVGRMSAYSWKKDSRPLCYIASQSGSSIRLFGLGEPCLAYARVVLCRSRHCRLFKSFFDFVSTFVTRFCSDKDYDTVCGHSTLAPCRWFCGMRLIRSGRTLRCTVCSFSEARRATAQKAQSWWH